MAPRLRPEDLRFDPPQLSLGVIASAFEAHWGLTGELTSLDGERDQNTRIVTADGRSFVLKIATPSEDPAIADLQCAVLDHIAAIDPALPVPRVVADLAGAKIVTIDVAGRPMAARLLSFLPGATFDDAGELPLDVIAATGRFQGRLARALREFRHPAATAFMAWSLDSGMLSTDELWDDLSPDGRRATEPFRERTVAAVEALADLPRQVLHHDGHRGNLLRQNDGQFDIVGVIDFGDACDTAVIADLAVSAASFGEGHSDPIAALAASTRGYHDALALSADEVALLPDLVLARRVLGSLLVEYQTRHAPPERLGEIAWELPVLRAGVASWGAVDRGRAIDVLVETVERAVDEDER